MSSLSYAGEKLGIGSSYTLLRFFLEALDKLTAFLVRLDELVTIEDTTISGVAVRIYQPKNTPVHIQPRPGLIYFHGGGLTDWHQLRLLVQL